jgi:hypothetical protein
MAIGTLDDERATARLDLARKLVERKRAEHPELREPLTWSACLAVLDREGVELLRTRLSAGALGRTLQLGGHIGILLAEDCPPHLELEVLAHELAHAWLHCPDQALTQRLREEAERYPDGGTLREQCEFEADMVAERLLRG